MNINNKENNKHFKIQFAGRVGEGKLKREKNMFILIQTPTCLGGKNDHKQKGKTFIIITILLFKR